MTAPYEGEASAQILSFEAAAPQRKAAVREQVQERVQEQVEEARPEDMMLGARFNGAIDYARYELRARQMRSESFWRAFSGASRWLGAIVGSSLRRRAARGQFWRTVRKCCEDAGLTRPGGSARGAV